MSKIRLKFSKTGEGSFISHLDLTRLFTRALTRARVKVLFTIGFNPHPFIVFTPPLSLGYESNCELVDFDVEDESIDFNEYKTRIDAVLPQGIDVLECYEPSLKFKDIAYSEFSIKIENNQKISDEDIFKINQLFEKPEVEILKRSKRGETKINIIEKIKNIKIQRIDDNNIVIDSLIASAPDDTLNPEYIIKVIEEHLNLSFDFVLYKREGFYQDDLKTFF